MNLKELGKLKSIKIPFYYGWVIVAIAATGLFFSGPGQTYFISTFIDFYINNFGWNRSLISSLYSTATLIAGLILPLIGRFIDNKGHRKGIMIVSVLLGVTCLWMSFVSMPIMLFVGFIFSRLLGQGSMTLIPSTLVPHWFVKRRGFALSLMALGSVIGSAMTPQINTWLIINTGANFTWRLWAFLLIGFMAPLGWILVKNRPKEIGLLPDGNIIEDNALIDKKFDIKITPREKSWTLKEAMKTRAFWLMLFSSAIPAMINTGLVFHMVSIMEKKGFSSSFAASILSTIAIVQFPLTFLAGYVLDRVKVHYIKAISFLIMALYMFVILKGQSTGMLLTYGVLSGVFSAFDSVSNGILWPNYFGMKHLGSIRGIAMTAMVIGSSLGPMPFGVAYDLFNGYGEIIALLIILPIVGSAASLLSPPPKYKEHTV